jgi:CRP/FNR family cyclic AMP-dependent transcriptional regulator
MSRRTVHAPKKSLPQHASRSTSKLSPTVGIGSPDTGALLSKIGYLSAMELFSDMTQAEKEEVSRAITMRTCRPGTVFYNPGETGEVMFLLKKGTVQIYRLSPEGRRLVIARLKPYSFFGEMSVLGQGMYESFAEAEDECVLCAMSRRDVERHIFSRPHLVVRILKAVGERMVEVEQMLEDAAFKGLVPRIASLLLREATADNEVKGLSHQEIADWLGVYRESATMALNQMKIAGLIEIGRRRIAILDRKRLERAAVER